MWLVKPSGIKSGLCYLYLGLATYWSFYHQLSWNILGLLTKKVVQRNKIYFSFIKLIYRHINVPSLILSTAGFVLFDKLKNTVFVAGSLSFVRGHDEPYRILWNFHLKDLFCFKNFAWSYGSSYYNFTFMSYGN